MTVVLLVISVQEKSRVEEENESSLLTALTEMLDSVGDEEGSMSPFDTLPDPEKHRDNSPVSINMQ